MCWLRYPSKAVATKTVSLLRTRCLGILIILADTLALSILSQFFRVDKIPLIPLRPLTIPSSLLLLQSSSRQQKLTYIMYANNRKFQYVLSWMVILVGSMFVTTKQPFETFRQAIMY